MSRDLTRSFLEDICANPDDDAPRLIFADWLDEHGKAGRAEFIRVQVRRASLPWWHADQIGLELREQALLKQHEKAWRKGLPRIDGVTWGGFERGFVVAAEVDNYSTLRAHASEITSAAPVQKIHSRWPQRKEKVGSIPSIPGLRELLLSSMLFDHDAATMLADAPLLATLTSLVLDECNLGLECFSRLIASPHLERLASLRAPQNSVGNGGIDALKQAPSLKNLTELDLSESGAYGRYGEDPILQAEGMESLAGWPGLARIRSLTLSGNDIRRRGLAALLKSRHARNLKELYVRDNGLKGGGMDVFATANRELRLDVLDVSENLMGDRAAVGLAKKSAALSELKVLRVQRCEMTSEGACALAKAAFLGTLEHLDAADNSFEAQGVDGILGAAPSCLHSLSLSNNFLGDSAVAPLADSAATNSLRFLDLSDNQFGGASLGRLFASRQFQNLLVLRLRHNRFGLPEELRESQLGKRLQSLRLGAEDEPD